MGRIMKTGREVQFPKVATHLLQLKLACLFLNDLYAQLAVDSLLRLYKLDSNYVTFHMGFSRQLTMESLAKTTFEDTKNFNTERRGSFGEVRLDIHIIYFFCAYFLLLTISNMDTQHALSQLKTVDQTWFEFIEIASIIVAWYMTSSLTNNLNKSILSENVSLSLSICAETFGFICFFCFMMFSCWPRSCKMQNIGFGFLHIVLPLCISQIVAHLLTQLSLQHVPVSFTHTVKGCSPIFAIILSRYYHFNEIHSFTLFFAVGSIIAGVILSSCNEINFNSFGFITALGSTLVFSWQNAYSKKVFRDKEMDHVNLLFYTSAVAFSIMSPVWLVLDFPKILSYFSSPEAPSFIDVIGLFLLNGICHFGQNITAFTFMTRVTPLTYTVFNTFKRTFVIISSIIYFGNSVGFLNSLGIALTTAGVALYNKAKLDMRSKRTNL